MSPAPKYPAPNPNYRVVDGIVASDLIGINVTILLSLSSENVRLACRNNLPPQKEIVHLPVTKTAHVPQNTPIKRTEG